MWEEKDIYWMAGLFDGEGSIITRKRTNGRKGSTKIYECVAVTMQLSDEDLLRRFSEIVGIGTVITVKRKTSTGKTMFCWTAAKQTDVLKFLEAVRPILCQRKKNLADIGIEKLKQKVVV